MRFIRYIILLVGFFFSNTQDSISQKKSSIAIAEDIFSDLPINDPSTISLLKPGESSEEKIKKNIFVSGAFNKTACYVGEPVLLSFELLSALKSTSTIQQLPGFNGFLTIYMDPNNEFPRSKQKNGLMFSVFTIKQLQLIPDKEGNIKIGPITVNNEVTYIKDKKSYSYSGVVNSSPVNLHVQPLPQKDRPINFSGAIGDFKVKASVKFDSFPAGENNKLEIEISGSGNFFSVKALQVSWPSSFHDFGVSEKSALDDKVFPVNGKRIFSIPFIADQPGKFTIPSIELNYFDPSSKKYHKSVTGDIDVVVLPPIHRLKDDAPEITLQHPKKKNFWLYFIVTGLVLLLGIFYVVWISKKSSVRKQKLIEESIKQEEQAEAENNKIKTVKATIENLANLKTDENYMLQFKQGLVDYLHVKLNDSAAFPDDMVRSIKEIDFITGEELRQLFAECDMLLYAGILPDNSTRTKLVLILNTIVKKLENNPINK